MTRILHARALRIAEAICEELAPACKRIEIAGSVRRLTPTAKDIEIVAMPKPRLDLFGGTLQGSELDLLLEDLIAANRIQRRLMSDGRKRWGPRYKAATAVRAQMPLDLFVVHEAGAWGGCMAIRTGPAEYSKHLVSRALDVGLQCRGNILYDRETGEVVPTPEERDFIEACGEPWREPRDRY